MSSRITPSFYRRAFAILLVEDYLSYVVALYEPDVELFLCISNIEGLVSLTLATGTIVGSGTVGRRFKDCSSTCSSEMGT